MITQTKKSSALRKLHSVHSLLIEREFIGEIASGKKFVYSPASVALVSGKIELTGSFTIKSAGQTRKAQNVKATLLATQGGIQAAPPTPKGATASMLGDVPSGDKPATDATGSRAYVAVIYFKLSAMNGAKLGVAFDLSGVQLNARLNPADDIARALQFWFSVAVRAVLGETQNSRLMLESFNEINKLLKV
ncbi:MAG: hypothetical protein ACRD82_07280 [Blastocatellia bacterium]